MPASQNVSGSPSTASGGGYPCLPSHGLVPSSRIVACAIQPLRSRSVVPEPPASYDCHGGMGSTPPPAPVVVPPALPVVVPEPVPPPVVAGPPVAAGPLVVRRG